MKIVIIGAGVVGITTAHALSRRGHEVIVVDRQSGAAEEASFANGSLLTPGMPHPWNTPGCWHELLGSLARSDSALKLRWQALPSLLGWGLNFLRESAPDRFEKHAIANLRLALYSVGVMESIRTDTSVHYDQSALGSLRIFRERRALERARESAERLSAYGLRYRELTTANAVELEPGLMPIGSELYGAIHYQDDEVGNARSFSLQLKSHTERCGARYLFRTQVAALWQEGDKVTIASREGTRESCDACIVAAGSYTSRILAGLGIEVPVRPIKGYSVTFAARHDDALLSIPILDDDFHAAVVPLPGSVRVAGTAEFAGYNTSLDMARVRNLTTLLGNVLPRVPLENGNAWCGLRSVSSDGVPIIGATPLRGVFVNTGHGHLGWTMAAGSAELMADVLEGKKPVLERSDYALERFG